MKKTLLVLFAITICSITRGQSILLKAEIKDYNEIICSSKKVFALFSSMNGQDEAVCPITKAEILVRLNNEVKFLKKSTKHNEEGLIRLVISCKGEVVESKMYKNTKNEELDKQIKDIFNSLGLWKSGKLNGENVNSSKIYKFKIEKGKFTF